MSAGFINSGWANNSGVELFTLGWVVAAKEDRVQQIWYGPETRDKLSKQEQDILTIVMVLHENDWQ
jgi:hypothetical protein